MELELSSTHFNRRKPDWSSALVAGLVAGGVAMVMDLLWTSLILGHNPWHTSYLVAALVMGPDLLQGIAQGFNLGVVAVALLTHYMLGMIFGVAIAVIITAVRSESSLPLMMTIGAFCGGTLYGFNFYVMAKVFPWVVELRGESYVVEHYIFGMTAAFMYWKLKARGNSKP